MGASALNAIIVFGLVSMGSAFLLPHSATQFCLPVRSSNRAWCGVTASVSTPSRFDDASAVPNDLHQIKVFNPEKQSKNGRVHLHVSGRPPLQTFHNKPKAEETAMPTNASVESYHIPVRYKPKRVSEAQKLKFKLLRKASNLRVGEFFGLRGDMDRGSSDTQLTHSITKQQQHKTLNPYPTLHFHNNHNIIISKSKNKDDGRRSHEDLTLEREHQDAARRSSPPFVAFRRLSLFLAAVTPAVTRHLLAAPINFAWVLAVNLARTLLSLLLAGGLPKLALDRYTQYRRAVTKNRRPAVWMRESYLQTQRTHKQVRSDLSRLSRRWAPSNETPPLICFWRQGVQICLRATTTSPSSSSSSSSSVALPSNEFPFLTAATAAYERRRGGRSSASC